MMPNDQAAAARTFMAYTAQQGTMTPGFVPQTSAGMIPGLGPANMIMQPMLQSAMGQMGMVPGDFMGQQNVYDVMRAQAYQRQQMANMAAAMQAADTQTWLATTEGAMRAAGQPFGLDQKAAFGQTYRAMAPYMAMLGQVAPDIVDALHGSRGSAAVMTQNMARGMQYRLDSVTGMPGMSAKDAEQLSTIIREQLYGTDAQVAQMRGVGMGQLGSIFDEGARRGFLPGSLSARRREAQIEAMSARDPAAAAALAGLNDEEFGKKTREFDTNRVAMRLKELAGSVSAMREIFGSMGQPNAPMAQIINALEALTQNKLATMPASRVEHLVRQTKSVMETTGIGLDALLSLTSQAAAYGDSKGLDRSLAVQAGMHAASFGHAYKNSFGSDFTMFGAASADVITAREARMVQNAASSEQARLAGSVLRTVDAFKMDPESRMGRLAAALRNGETEFEGRSLYQVLRKDQLAGIFRASGGTESQMGAFNAAMNDRFGNQEYIERHDLGSVVRRLHGEELIDRAGTAAGRNAIMNSLRARGMSVEDARTAGDQAAPGLLNEFLNSESPEELSTQEGRQAVVQRALARTFGADKASAMAPEVALSFESQMHTLAKRHGYENFAQLLQQQNRMVLRQQRQVERVAGADAEISRLLSPLGKAGPIQRVIDMLQKGDGNDDIMEAVGTALGGIKIDDIKALMADSDTMRQLAGKEKLTPEEQKTYELARKRLEAHVGDVTARAKADGVDIGRRVDDETLARNATGLDALDAARANRRLSPEERQAAVDKHMRLSLARTNNIVQSLYLDEASLKKLGAGGVDQLKSLEGKYLQMLRLTGGDTDLLSRALAGDKGVDKKLRDSVAGIYAGMSEEFRTLQKELTGAGTPMTEEEFAAEKIKLKALQDERMRGDDDQVTKMLDQLGTLGSGFKGKEIGAEDRAELTALLGGFGEARRKDLMLAISAREKIAGEAKRRGLSVKDLQATGAMAEEFQQAGTLVEFGRAGMDDVEGLKATLREFAPEGRPKDQQKLEVTGTLTLQEDGTGALAGTGSMAGGAFT